LSDKEKMISAKMLKKRVRNVIKKNKSIFDALAKY